MQRAAINELYRWKESKNRKPLILDGARQVGKTWLMKEFGRLAYKEVIYVSLDVNTQIASAFESSINPNRIISTLELSSGKKINPDDTLIILDEIQQVPRALTSLKYFYEDAPQYHIICAGSLLGIALHEGTSFPVGKVEFLSIQPLSFREFLDNTYGEQYVSLLETMDFDMMASFRGLYTDALREYLIVGGMPEVVQIYIDTKDFSEVRRVQNMILVAYEQDFSKHAPSAVVPRIRAVWDNIPSQLAKQNKKFVYGLIKDGARAKDYETAIMWLCDCGLVRKISRVTTARLPLKSYVDTKAFKLYAVDVGLLGCMAFIKPEIILDGDRLFTEFRGSLVEAYVCQQLHTDSDIRIYYYTNDRNSAEIDFVIDTGEKVVPIEAKASINLKAKSLKVYRELFDPSISIRTSMADYKENDGLFDIPLYAVSCIADICANKITPQSS